MRGLYREGVETSVSLGAKVIFSWLGPLASVYVPFSGPLFCLLLPGTTTNGAVSG